MASISQSGQSRNGSVRKEAWRSVPGYGGHYLASSHGRIKVRARVVTKRHYKGKIMLQRYQSRLLTPFLSNGYWTVSIGYERKTLTVGVHVMVLSAFKGERPSPDLECCHWDGNPVNNHPSNLRWGTPKDNAADRKRHGRYLSCEHHPMAKLSESQARQIALDPRLPSIIANEFGVGLHAVRAIKSGETWSHLKTIAVPSPGLAARRNRKGEDHPRHKITEDDVRSIRADCRVQSEIAADYGLTQGSVSAIKLRQTWRHVD